MPARVVDASDVAAIAFAEPRAEEALALLGTDDLYAPSLLAYELTTVARKKSLLYPDQAQFFAELLHGTLPGPINTRDVAHPAVLRLALQKEISTYDASYLHLSDMLRPNCVRLVSPRGCPMWGGL